MNDPTPPLTPPGLTSPTPACRTWGAVLLRSFLNAMIVGGVCVALGLVVLLVAKNASPMTIGYAAGQLAAQLGFVTFCVSVFWLHRQRLLAVGCLFVLVFALLGLSGARWLQGHVQERLNFNTEASQEIEIEMEAAPGGTVLQHPALGFQIRSPHGDLEPEAAEHDSTEGFYSWAFSVPDDVVRVTLAVNRHFGSSSQGFERFVDGVVLGTQQQAEAEGIEIEIVKQEISVDGRWADLEINFADYFLVYRVALKEKEPGRTPFFVVASALDSEPKAARATAASLEFLPPRDAVP